jgi:enolase
MTDRIRTVSAREVISARGHPGVETTIFTENGASGTAVATAGTSVGKHETVFIYDGGSRWGGLGVKTAVNNVDSIIGPAIRGLDITSQGTIDQAMIKLDGTSNKSRLGGNAIASVSAAVFKAAANSLRVPLYQHIGGVDARILPVPNVGVVCGSERYGGGERSGGKPNYAFLPYGFHSYSDASYACWESRRELRKRIRKKYDLDIGMSFNEMPTIPPGKVEDDRELWDVMTEAIEELGYSKKVAIQMDAGAGTYYDEIRNTFVGLFSKGEKTRAELIELYENAAATYPFLIIEDPLDEEDYEGHAILTKKLRIEIVGDDLFATTAERLRRGIEVGACNAFKLKVNQIGTITEALDAVALAYRNNYGVMPCASRGEGSDIADYAVGLNTGHMDDGGIDDAANRLLKIELELGTRATFLGKGALKIGRT